MLKDNTMISVQTPGTFLGSVSTATVLEAHSLETKYADFVNSKFKSMPSAKEDLLHATFGIVGEAGEIADAIKKHYFYNKPLDLENVIEELGDLEFYMQALRMCLAISRKDILIANMVKLSKRYGTGSYSDAQAQARADKLEATANQVDSSESFHTLAAETFKVTEVI